MVDDSRPPERLLDISDQKRAEDALRESEERYRTLAESTSDVIYILSENGTLLYANRAAAAYVGVPPSAVVGMTQRDLFPPEMAERHMERIRHVFATGEPGEMDACYRFGPREVWLNVRSIPIRDEQGRVSAVMGVCRKITDRKRAEEALQQAHDVLEHKVRQRTADLTAANEALQREQRTLEHLLRASDHERQVIAYEIHDGLAQYLTGAIMQFQMHRHQKDKCSAEASRCLDAGLTMVHEGLAEARRLISGVRPPILDESGVVAAIGHLAHEVRAQHGVKVDLHSNVDFDRLAPTLENTIYRIAQEALTNACLHSQSAKVRTALRQEDDRLRIEIEDWGVGFDPNTVADGHFGLEGIRERARLLGGSAQIDSAPGQGARIAVGLPIIARKDP